MTAMAMQGIFGNRKNLRAHNTADKWTAKAPPLIGKR